MTDTPTKTDTPVETEAEQLTDPDRQTDTAEPRPDTEPRTDTGLEPDSERIKRYLAWGALGVCSLLAVFALVQFYGSATDAIDLWVDPKYQPLMRAAFNLAVLLTSLIGVSLLVGELSE
ncbi:hypothetical protein [Natronorubrum sp. FCH18a]|uniref:hypothetical protein n=1 Tax=Natronorubrum sp. FCH18a TaxID=3447018 RepID=UPI003F518ADD